MKTRHTILVTITAVALASCSSYSTPNLGLNPDPSGPSSQIQAPDGNNPTPEVKPGKGAPIGHPDPQARPNMVVSPFRPYNIINVKGFRSGDIVGDPSTAKVNPATGKLDLSTSKHFRIP